MRGRKLTTIYSVGEGRTIVFATDGCKNCLAAFSILIESLPRGPESPDGNSDDESTGQCAALTKSLSHDGRKTLGKLTNVTPFEKQQEPRGKQTWNEKIPFMKKDSGMFFSPTLKPRKRTPAANVGDVADNMELAEEPGGVSREPGGVSRDPDSVSVSGSPTKGKKEKASLLILDPTGGIGNAVQQDLSLRFSDRLIVALYTPPPSLPGILHKDGHSEKESSGRGKGSVSVQQPLAAIGELLKLKKPGAAPKSRVAQLAAEEPAPLPVQTADAAPKVGPGQTTIFMPMAVWSEVETCMDRWEEGRERECLIRMVQTARMGKVRFEAVKLEEPCTEEEGVKGKVQQMLPSNRRHSAGLGQSVASFCEEVEAEILLLGLMHAHPGIEFRNKEFNFQLIEHCSQLCSCSVRLLSTGQLKS